MHFRAIIYFSRWLRTHCAYSASVLCDKYDKEITNFEEDKTDTHKYGMVGVVLKLVAEMVRMVVVLMVMLIMVVVVLRVLVFFSCGVVDHGIGQDGGGVDIDDGGIDDF